MSVILCKDPFSAEMRMWQDHRVMIAASSMSSNVQHRWMLTACKCTLHKGLKSTVAGDIHCSRDKPGHHSLLRSNSSTWCFQVLRLLCCGCWPPHQPQPNLPPLLHLLLPPYQQEQPHQQVQQQPKQQRQPQQLMDPLPCNQLGEDQKRALNTVLEGSSIFLTGWQQDSAA